MRPIILILVHNIRPIMVMVVDSMRPIILMVVHNIRPIMVMVVDNMRPIILMVVDIMRSMTVFPRWPRTSRSLHCQRGALLETPLTQVGEGGT